MNEMGKTTIIQAHDDTQYGSAANGHQVGSGFDVDVKRESGRTALVLVTGLATGDCWLTELEVEPQEDLQALAVHIGNCPNFGDGDYVCPEDEEEWEALHERWEAISLDWTPKEAVRMNPFQATHVIRLDDGTTYEVMLDDEGRAYTRDEWYAEALADYERQDNGDWTCQGQPFNGTVERL